jgi:hypothetical protein
MKLTLTFIVALLTVSCFSQDCKKFRVGKFQNMKDGVSQSAIIRNDSIQIERMGDVEVSLKVEWINDCTYKLKFFKGNEAFWKYWPKGKPLLDLTVKIIETNGDSYTQESLSEGEDPKSAYRSTLKRL